MFSINQCRQFGVEVMHFIGQLVSYWDNWDSFFRKKSLIPHKGICFSPKACSIHIPQLALHWLIIDLFLRKRRILGQCKLPPAVYHPGPVFLRNVRPGLKLFVERWLELWSPLTVLCPGQSTKGYTSNSVKSKYFFPAQTAEQRKPISLRAA